MSNGISSLPREVLAHALGGDVRAVRAFEEEASINADTADRLAAQVDATDAINDATVLVLSPNAAFNNERVLKLGDGISARDDGSTLTLFVDDRVPHVTGGFAVQLQSTQGTFLQLPVRGLLATTDQDESLSNKTLVKPSVSGIGIYADDTAAAAAGVPVGGIYATATALTFRRA